MGLMNTIRTGAYLSSGAATFVLIGSLVLAYWWSPASPMTRDEPALRLSNGDIEGASLAYLEPKAFGFVGAMLVGFKLADWLAPAR